ncbi:high-affinity glucose transporter ght5 [Lipomyces oligophaga]|uniref:high-affinity glucose transporter ght5 n=1 Tax=Lipomyces oligophaga TaxID=45792 RepID=UPI0034CF3198
MFNINFKDNRWALLYCSISAIGALVYGYDNTYYSGVIAMQEFKNDFGDHYEDGNMALAVSFTSLTSSSIYIGDLLGALLSGPVNDRWGRKLTFWIASSCILAGGIVQVVDTHYEGIIVLGRILIGLGVGQFTVTSLLYMGEIAPVEIRGPALNMFQFLQSISQFVAAGLTQGSNSMNSSLAYKLPMGGLIILPLLMYIGLLIIPESPVWYVAKGKIAEAEKALQKINQSDQNYEPSADIIALEETKRRQEEVREGSSWLSLFVDPIERTKVVYSAGAMFCQQIGGILFFYSYGVIFAEAIGIKQPFTIQLITNVLQLLAVGISVLVGNKWRRRPTLFITTAMSFVAFIVIGSLGTNKNLSTGAQYVIVVFSYMIIIAANLGFGPLAYTIAREMCVGVNQNKIMSASIVIFYLTTWLVSFTAPYLYYNANLGPMICFIYAGTSIICGIYIYFCVGETTGRTTLELQVLFQEDIPARCWRTFVFAPEDSAMDKKLESDHFEGTESVVV